MIREIAIKRTPAVSEQEGSSHRLIAGGMRASASSKPTDDIASLTSVLRQAHSQHRIRSTRIERLSDYCWSMVSEQRMAGRHTQSRHFVCPLQVLILSEVMKVGASKLESRSEIYSSTCVRVTKWEASRRASGGWTRRNVLHPTEAVP